MSLVLLPPASDAGPNQAIPVPAGPHFACVDEDPHNGDTDRLQFSAAGDMEAFGLDVSSLQDGALVGAVRLRSTVQPGGGDASYRVGFRIAGVDYFAPERSQGAGAPYETREDVFAVSPATGARWTKPLLAAALGVYQQVTAGAALPKPRLTQLVALADVLETPPEAKASSLSPRAVTVEDLPSLRVSVSSLAPRAAVTSQAPAATPASKAPRGEGS